MHGNCGHGLDTSLICMHAIVLSVVDRLDKIHMHATPIPTPCSRHPIKLNDLFDATCLVNVVMKMPVVIIFANIPICKL